MPASIACLMRGLLSSSDRLHEWLPRLGSPKVIQPREIGEISRPVLPSFTYFIVVRQSPSSSVGVIFSGCSRVAPRTRRGLRRPSIRALRPEARDERAAVRGFAAHRRSPLPHVHSAPILDLLEDHRKVTIRSLTSRSSCGTGDLLNSPVTTVLFARRESRAHRLSVAMRKSPFKTSA